jgi:DNA mismatch endonuclease (patch repair protein)
MPDRHTPFQRSYNMSRIRSKNSRAELEVRRLLSSQGYRYRLHLSDLPGTPDIVLAKTRKVIFVHGCFWHRHDCSNGSRMPSTNVRYWTEKLAANQKRDTESQAALREQGWDVLVVWECEVENSGATVDRMIRFLSGPTSLPRVGTGTVSA